MVENHIFQFFHNNLDEHGTGRIGREEFQSVCTKYIGPETAATITDDIFRDLDSDVNGEISLKDLLHYVRSDLRENVADDDQYLQSTPERRNSERRKSEAGMAWRQLIDGIGEPTLKNMMNTSGRQLEEVYHELQTYESTSPNLVNQFEGALSSLLLEVTQVLEDNEKLKHMYNKEKEKHREQLRGLEEELDAQVAKVEEETRNQARKKFEQEKNEMMAKMESEMAEMEARLKLSQKMNQIFTKKKDENNTLKYQNYEDFCSTIIDAKTNLALVQSEMVKIKADYETKCRELNDHQEMVMHYMEQNKNIQHHLDLLHKANRSLQDTNDGLLSAVKTTGGRVTPFCCSRRASSEINSTYSSDAPQPCKPRTVLIHNLFNVNQGLGSDQINETETQYVIQRLMEDVDSGRSTLRDPLECDSDRKSIYEEFCSLSDGESIFKSLESDDSKHLKHRIRCRADFIPSNTTSFENGRDPDRTYKVVLAGDSSVGKSCFIHRFCKGAFDSRLSSTLGVDFQIRTIRIDEKNVALQLWDTAGQERFRSMTKTYFRRSDGIILLYDVTNERSFLNMKEWIQSINESSSVKSIPILICGNKEDIRGEMKNIGAKCIAMETGSNLARDFNAIFYETSSKTGKNIIDALIALTREMLRREDVEVQTSALSVTSTVEKKRSCC